MALYEDLFLALSEGFNHYQMPFWVLWYFFLGGGDGGGEIFFVCMEFLRTIFLHISLHFIGILRVKFVLKGNDQFVYTLAWVDIQRK